MLTDQPEIPHVLPTSLVTEHLAVPFTVHQHQGPPLEAFDLSLFTCTCALNLQGSRNTCERETERQTDRLQVCIHQRSLKKERGTCFEEPAHEVSEARPESAAGGWGAGAGQTSAGRSRCSRRSCPQATCRRTLSCSSSGDVGLLCYSRVQLIGRGPLPVASTPNNLNINLSQEHPRTIII